MKPNALGPLKLVVKLLKRWAEARPRDRNYFFQEAEVYEQCMGLSYHPTDKVRAAALAEFVTKMDALLDYLNS